MKNYSILGTILVSVYVFVIVYTLVFEFHGGNVNPAGNIPGYYVMTFPANIFVLFTVGFAAAALGFDLPDSVFMITSGLLNIVFIYLTAAFVEDLIRRKRKQSTDESIIRDMEI